MCSILGYTGNRLASPLLVKGLKCMEYRGYDSVGLATFSGNYINVKKGSGKVSEVNAILKLDNMNGTIGIGHTRWATHGKVNDINAHPHISNSGSIAIVHNGIIDNYVELKIELEKYNFIFKSDTDSEIISNLLQYYYQNIGQIKSALLETISKLRGCYSFVALFDDGTMAAARFREPLIIGVGNDGFYISSDVLGFIENTDNVIYPDNGECVIVQKNGIQIFDFKGNPVYHQITKVSKEFADVYRGEYAHFTLKEINEQPKTILRAGKKSEISIGNICKLIKSSKNVYVAGSGTSYNACLVAKHLFSKYAKLQVEPLISSEVQFSSPNFDSQSILIAMSQSGESADVIEAVNSAKDFGTKVVSIVNIMNSSLANLSSDLIGLNCGPEIGVAATKSFMAQLAVLYKLTAQLSEDSISLDFQSISTQMMEVLSYTELIKEISAKLKDVADIYVLGRGIHFPIALEASLKLKELAYIHAEGLPGGELKHGPLALIDPKTVVIVINPTDCTYENTLVSVHEIKSRGAKIIGISDKYCELYDYWIKIPKVDEHLFPMLEIIPLQLLSYYFALERNADPDYPRNLAKSVTVK